MNPMIPISLALLASLLAGVAVFQDFYGYTRLALAMGLVALVAFAAMIVTLQDVNWGNAPAYNPQTCIDLAHLDGRWTCIPREEAG